MSVCVCVCQREREGERECVCERERERKRERARNRAARSRPSSRAPRFYPRVQVSLVMYDSGQVFLEHLLFSWYPSQSLSSQIKWFEKGSCQRNLPRMIDSGLVGSTDFHSPHPQGHASELGGVPCTTSRGGLEVYAYTILIIFTICGIHIY